ncbi:MKI67 FHA domain-interacting nucleolar phosphoprotein-like isoform X2 [Bacillus rossius redtenbacheri]
MRDYFGQFGTVTNVKLARSNKTGKSKGFAFVEFQHAEVGQVVAETMNNYIMCNRLLKAEFIPQDRIRKRKFWRSNATARNYLRLRNRRKDSAAKNAEKSQEKVGKLLRKRRRHAEAVLEKLSAHGISYKLRDFDDPVTTPLPQPPQPPTPVLEIDESDDEIEFKIRPDFSLKRIMKKSKKTSRKQKVRSSGNEAADEENCKSPEPKLHLMDVKKNLFGNSEVLSLRKGRRSLEAEDVNAASSPVSAGDGTTVHRGKSATKVADDGKRRRLSSGMPTPPSSARLREESAVTPKSKNKSEKLASRLQKKLKRSRGSQPKGVSPSDSAGDKSSKKTERGRKSTLTKVAKDGSPKKFASKKLSLKGKLKGFAELGV